MIEIQLPERTIGHADERAAFFFLVDESSVGELAYDRRVVSRDNPLDQIERADIECVNRTMRARTPYKVWEPLTNADAAVLWLTDLDQRWNLFEMNESSWVRAHCRDRLEAAFTEILGPYRTTAIATKVLGLKRPKFIPICDSYVVAMLGGKAGNASVTAELVERVRDVGRQNLGELREIKRQLAHIGVARSLVRILDSILWSSYQVTGRFASFEQWLVKHHGGRLFFP